MNPKFIEGGFEKRVVVRVYRLFGCSVVDSTMLLAASCRDWRKNKNVRRARHDHEVGRKPAAGFWPGRRACLLLSLHSLSARCSCIVRALKGVGVRSHTIGHINIYENDGGTSGSC